MDNVTLVAPEILYREIQDIINLAVKPLIKSETEEQLLSAAAACSVFTPTISVKTLLRWTAEGQVPSYKIGRMRFYKRSEIVAAAQVIKKYKRA